MVDAFREFPNLLTPFKVGNVVFKHKMLCAPTGHTDIMPTGQPSMDAVMYLERRAIGGAASVACGEVNVDPSEMNPGRWPRDIMKHHNFNYPRIASKIARHGAVPVIELQYSGAKSHSKREEPFWGPVDMDDFLGSKVRAMTEERIMEVIEGYGKTAMAAKNAGFYMVSLHGSHGWGLEQFFTPYFNTRTDRWGGNTENRCRFAVMAIDEIHRVCGRDFPVEIRISGSEIISPGYGVDEAIRIAEQLDGHADIIHISVGNVQNSKQVHSRTHVSMFYPQGRNVEYAAAIKKHVKKSLVAAVGGMSDPYFMEEVLATGKADMVYMARQIMCDPDFPSKVRTGRIEEIQRCMRCMTCYSECMTHGDFFCALNPEMSRERETVYELPTAQKQKVLVIGGGIAGMEAALVAARNGHEVVLCEKSGELGGAVLCQKDVPFKELLYKYIEHQRYLIDKSDIEVRLNTPVTPEYAKKEKADVVIAAVGSVPVKPEIQGICGKNVHQAIDVYSDTSLAKGKVVIIGAGLAGTELAIYLHDLLHEVEVVEMLDEMPDGGNYIMVSTVTDIIEQKRLPIHFKTKAVEITQKGVRCEGPDGEVFYEADTVIYAAGMKALQEEALVFNECSPNFHMIGDCRKASNILNATSTAYTTAKCIGRFTAV